MFPHTGRVVLVSLAVLLVLSSILAQTVPGTASSPPLATAAQNSAGQTLADAFKSLDGEKFDVAREGFALALKQAIDDNNRAAEGEAHRGLGIVFYRQDRYPSARTELQEALAIFTELGDKYRIAKVRQHMGSVALMMGNQNEARELYRSALETYEQAGARADKARLLDNYAFLNISIEEKLQAIGEALEISRELGEKKLEGHCLHHRGDINFGVGNYVDAAEDYDRAVVLFKEVNARENLSRAFMSLGRLQRAHGHLDTAMPYYQEALKIQTEIGDRQGAIQSLNGIAVTLSLQGDFDQAIQYYEPALAIARSTGSPRLVGFIVGNLAALYTHNTQYDRAVEVLEELIRQTTTGDLLAQRYFQLGQTYRLMGRLQDGLQAVQMSLEQVRKQQNVDLLLKVLQERAVIWQRLGNQSNALDDIQETMQILEQLRTKLVPSDYLKRGFAEQHQALFSFAIESLWHNRRYDEALAVAEQGRARALLDLLASRDPQSNAAADMSSQAGRSAHPDAQADLPSLLALLRSQSVLPSTASEHAVTVDDIGAIARQLHSTILEYWTTTDATYLWVVGPDGQIRARRLALNSKQLERQIAQLWGIQHEETPVKLAANSNINKLGNSRIALTMRGGRIVFRSDEVNIWRRLYDELIRPVATWLPKASGSLISVVPHGPLFQLPFAGLNDGKSYLVERYSTHYAPSISVLRFTASRKRRGNSDSALLVGDPDLPTTAKTGPALAPVRSTRG